MKHKNYISNGNAKLKQDSIFTWGIPAYESKTGLRTCPNAGSCLKGCYARQGFYVMPSVSVAQEARLALAMSPGFVDTLDAEIKRRKIIRMRIHDSGDFFSVAYTNAWLEIIRRNPGTRFYAYTKMVRFFKAREALLPSNFHVIYSQGGTQDRAIDASQDRHSAVFSSEAEMKASGYFDTFKSDLNAFLGKQKIGLVYHGAPSRSWATV